MKGFTKGVVWTLGSIFLLVVVLAIIGVVAYNGYQDAALKAEYSKGDSKTTIKIEKKEIKKSTEQASFTDDEFLKDKQELVFKESGPFFGIKKNDVDWLADNLKIRYTNWEISFVDLTDNLSNIKKNFRKRYKSLINNGLRALHSEIFYGENMTEKQLDKFRELHARAAGRVTRKVETWLQQLKQIREKYGFC